MALVLDDRIKESSTTILTADYVLLGAITGFQSFAAIGNGNTTWYMATDGADWEVGIGTYSTTGPTLARTTIISSSNADAAVSWGAGTRTIVCTMPSSKAFVGPASATDNAIVRYDGTGGRTVQSSGVTISDTDVLTVPALIDISGASAGQIKFPATQNASADANTLDDFEEGSFTPTFTFATPGDLSITYNGQTGKYTKIARTVLYSVLINTSAFTHTTAASFFEIAGFPFTIGTQFLGSGHAMLNGYTKAGYHNLQLETSNSTFMYYNAGGSGVAMAELTTADVPTGGTPRTYAVGHYDI